VSRSGASRAFVPLNGDVGFYGTPPIAKPAALSAANATVFTAADASALDLVYGAEELAVLGNARTRLAELTAVVDNLRTRQGQLEARLRSFGLLP
jgi:hypothetical protein